MKKHLILAALLCSACTTDLNVPNIHHNRMPAQTSSHHLYKASSVQDANSWVNTHIAYEDDKDDVWQTPDQTIRRGKGDCEDFALLKRQIIIESGISTQENITILMVQDVTVNKPHVVIIVNGWVLDNQISRTYGINSRTFKDRYRALAVVNPKAK